MKFQVCKKAFLIKSVGEIHDLINIHHDLMTFKQASSFSFNIWFVT